MLFGEGVSCRVLYSFVGYLYVSGSVSVSSVGEERAYLSAIVYLLLCGFCWRGFLLLWALRISNVILLWHSLSLLYNYLVLWSFFKTRMCSTGSMTLCLYSENTITVLFT